MAEREQQTEKVSILRQELLDLTDHVSILRYGHAESGKQLEGTGSSEASASKKVALKHRMSVAKGAGRDAENIEGQLSGISGNCMLF